MNEVSHSQEKKKFGHKSSCFHSLYLSFCFFFVNYEIHISCPRARPACLPSARRASDSCRTQPSPLSFLPASSSRNLLSSQGKVRYIIQHVSTIPTTPRNQQQAKNSKAYQVLKTMACFHLPLALALYASNNLECPTIFHSPRKSKPA